MDTSKRFLPLLISSLLLALASFSAAATVYSVPPARMIFQGEYQCCTIDLHYNAATEHLYTSAAFGTPLTPAVIFGSPLYPTGVTNDIVGIFTMSAHVNHRGEVFGGAYSWYGTSARMGIRTPELLIAGQILGSIPESVHLGTMFARVGALNPRLRALGPEPDFALLAFTGGLFCFCDDIPGFWLSDRTIRVRQPDIMVYDTISPRPNGLAFTDTEFEVSVPEPTSLALIGIGVLGIFVSFVRPWKHRRNI